MKKHGLSMDITRNKDTFLLSMKVKGKLTHEDYQRVIPMIDEALEGAKEPKLTVLLDARELDGWELRAMWDDFKLGLKYRGTFEKVALCGNKKWQRLAAKLGQWFISGELKYFEDLDEASEWVGIPK